MFSKSARSETRYTGAIYVLLIPCTDSHRRCPNLHLPASVDSMASAIRRKRRKSMDRNGKHLCRNGLRIMVYSAWPRRAQWGNCISWNPTWCSYPKIIKGVWVCQMQSIERNTFVLQTNWRVQWMSILHSLPLEYGSSYKMIWAHNLHSSTKRNTANLVQNSVIVFSHPTHSCIHEWQSKISKMFCIGYGLCKTFT